MKSSIRNLFRKPYFIFVLLLTVATVSVWTYLWFGLSSYESGLPKNLMSNLIEEIAYYAEQGNCEAVIAEYNTTPTVGTYEYKGALLADLAHGQALSYRKTVGQKSDHALYYSIFAGDDEIARATLTQDENKGILGLSVYEISELSGTKELTILSPADALVYLKGVELNALDIKDTGVIPRELQLLYEYPENKIDIPVYNEYFVRGLFSMPDITDVDIFFSDGTKAESVFLQKDYILAGQAASEKLLDELTAWIEVATKKYSYYMSDDLGWTGFKGYLVSTSPIYDRLRTLEVGWYTLHDSTRFENMQISDFFVFSDDFVSLRLSYDYIVLRRGTETTYNTDLTYFIARDTDGKWRIAEMIVN